MDALGGLSSNITEQSVKRIGKSIQGLPKLSHHFDECNNVPTPTGYHTRKPKTKDVKMMVEQLNKSNVFKFHDGRSHQNFKKFVSNPCKTVNRETLKEWMDGHMKKLYR